MRLIQVLLWCLVLIEASFGQGIAPTLNWPDADRFVSCASEVEDESR